MHRKMAGGPRYRPEIDGLRAVAIVPVVLHHADVPGFGGGYVGVDVFFVISGYLITRLLLAEAEDGGISIMRFYARRVRRIAPALLALLLVLLIGGLAILPAEDLLREAKNAVATLAFASNIRFAGLTGYFDDAATEQLLLHTWSLAVEEQYYLVFPLLLAAAIRARAALRPLLWAVTLLSFAGAVRWVAIDPTFAFYTLPARAWELLGGALLAAGAVPAFHARRAREAAGVLGFALIAASVVFYTPQTNFPGIAALSPVLGAMLLIHAGDGTAMGRLLSRPLPVGIGLISYSLYLWHWPILVLREQFLLAPGTAGAAAAIALSVVLASASWRWVEGPFRDRTRMSDRRLFLACGGVVLTISLLAAAIIAGHGFPARKPAASAWYDANAAHEQAFQTSPCLVHGGSALPPAGPCIVGAVGGGGYRMAVWGDSHAAHWRTLFGMIGREGGFGVRMVTKAGCPPFVTRSIFPRDPSRVDCPAFNRAALEALRSDPNVHTVVLAANWQGVLEGYIRLSPDAAPTSLDQSRREAAASISRTVDMLRTAGKRVVLIGQTPIPDVHPVRCVGRRRAAGLDDSECGSWASASAVARDSAAAALLRGAGPDIYLSPFGGTCDQVGCLNIANGNLLYIDAAHLSADGAARLLSAARAAGLTNAPAQPAEAP